MYIEEGGWVKTGILLTNLYKIIAFNLPFLDHKCLQSPNCFVVSISDSFSVAQLR